MIEAILDRIVGKPCAKSLASLDIAFGCFKLLVSKLLGIGIILGSSVIKVPQIIKIVGAKYTNIIITNS